MIDHVYLSTACWHADQESDPDKSDELHGYCKAMTGQSGAKRPGRCKFCNARCWCPCHD